MHLQRYPFSIFVPVGGSYLIDDALAQLLYQQQCQLILSGSNVPFVSQALEKSMAEKMPMIPSYRSSGGMACAFSAFMQNEILIENAEGIFNFIRKKTYNVIKV